MRVHECERVRACVRACMRACVMCIAIYDNNILARLIMIIIKIIILFFIQIRHIDDFPSTGTRLAKYNQYFKIITENIHRAYTNKWDRQKSD